MDIEELGKWLRLAGALRRYGDYVQARTARKDDDDVAGHAEIGIASTVDQFKRQAAGVAAKAGLEEEFLQLFSLREDLKDLGTAKLESILVLLVAMTGWVEGQVEMLTIEERILAEAQALTIERSKKVGFQAGTDT
jgi:hypothetical protein